MASNEVYSDGRQSDAPGTTPTLELGASGLGCHTPPNIGSPTSSQGSWVVDPDEGWDGQGAGPTHTISLQAPFLQPQQPQQEEEHQLQQQQQQQQQQERQQQQQQLRLQQQQQQNQLSPRSSPTLSPLRSWARVPRSPPAAEYPAIGSPPSSPGGSVRSANSSSAGRVAAAGDGLVALARDEICDDGDVIFTDTTDALNAHGSVALPAEEAVVGCTAIDDVDMLDVAAGDSDEEPFVIAVGMTAEEAVEAIAEEAELGATEPPSMSLGCVAVSPPRRAARAVSIENAYGYPRQGVTTLSAEATPPRNAPSPVGAAPAEVAFSSPVHSTIADTGSRMAPPREPLLPMPACVPLDGTVGDNYDGIALAAGDADDKYDGKQLDRLWRWTGLITAAKMGVIPIIVCATVAALSTQTSGGSGDRGGRTSGGGTGGGGGGGGGGTRCSSRRPRPRGGGGGTGCFPDFRADRSSYGCMPMPYCVAPSVVCA